MNATPLTLATLLASLALVPAPVRAHCDTLDGPVVGAARKALETGQLAPVLAWVQPDDEPEIRGAFDRARAVRKAGGEARALADTWFFETLVRVHRAGEGAPYTGLKPAGLKLTPAVAAADAAVAKGSAAELERLLVEGVRHGLHERFARLKAQKPPAGDVAAGRAWVAQYVPFVHWIEAVDAAAAGGGAHGEPGAHEGHGAPAGTEAAAEPARAAPHHGD
ncbi:MAG TPA: DUF6448 family protein [Anaeromyxobacteraceae bacterium]|nr:DUF6448 family protein [Anaeromyxobacteraceae bacterium]